MRSAANVNGHPIHPMLVAFPAAYLFGSACVDLFARATGRRRWFRTASHLNALGIASALAAAIPGLIDYMFVVPPKSSAKNRATDHMFANLSALAMFALARAGRREEDQPAAPWAMAAEVAGVGLLTTGGWLGGTLACGVVQCPWHGSQFDVASGAVEQGPAAERIHTYDVAEHDGRIYISVG